MHAEYASVVIVAGQYKMWYQEYKGALCYTLSNDKGANWTDPVRINLSGQHPNVIYVPETGTYRMWYLTSDPVYDLRYAESGDGINWTHGIQLRDASLTSVKFRQANVVETPEGFLMYYLDIYTTPWSFRCVRSADGGTNDPWVSCGADPVFEAGASGWDSYSIAGPSVRYNGTEGSFQMGYSGSDSQANRIGMAVSTDGMTWTRCPENPIIDKGVGSSIIPDTIIFDGEDGRYRLFFSDFMSNGIWMATGLPNQPPIANAGPDQTVEQESYAGTEVTLDGSGSTDPDSTPGTNDDIVYFDWWEGDIPLWSGETIDYVFPLGSHTVILKVTDSFGETDEDEVIITVVDTTPPAIELFEPDPSVLWPPNHKFVDVVILGIADDICDAGLDIDVSVEVLDAEGGDGGPNHEPDYEVICAGIVDGDVGIIVSLRAERSGIGDGRVYRITATVTDDSGNSTTSNPVEVTVPHDHGNGKGKGKK